MGTTIAPGGPGSRPTWTSSAKDMVMTALGTSRVWVTLGYGILNEIYWPATGQPQISDLGFIVAGPSGWFEVKRVNRISDLHAGRLRAVAAGHSSRRRHLGPPMMGSGGFGGPIYRDVLAVTLTAGIRTRNGLSLWRVYPVHGLCEQRRLLILWPRYQRRRRSLALG